MSKKNDGVILSFAAGTLVVEADEEIASILGRLLIFDERIGKYRAQAHDYAAIMRMLHACKIPLKDLARNYNELPELTLYTNKSPLMHQREAMSAWKEEKCRAVVVMPTGSGKTFFAFMAMAVLKRATLVIVPTIDLLQQWASQLEAHFKCKIGMLGGGSKEICDITVSTYDSAVLQMEFIGNRFGFVIFDECHHLPGAVNRMSASMCLAPYRLGLTATPERQDDGGEIMNQLIGKIAYYAHIDELEGSVLAPYLTKRIKVELSDSEMEEYKEARKKYTDFVRSNGIDFTQPEAWGKFIALCARKPGGREVMNAYLAQRRIARCGNAKLNTLWEIILNNPDARTIIFTADNDTAYRIGEQLCLPVLTHKTKAAERKEFLDSFRNGTYPVLVTSKVLNEGVDVPEASIGIVVSGSASTREHVQRLGRILRASDGKQAILYELVSEGTSEMSVSDRRRQSRPYQKKFSFTHRGGYHADS